MENKDFKIEGTVLKRYTGNDSTVIIPNGVVEIGNNAFHQCQNIKHVKIPDSIESIGNLTFFDCRHLISVELGNNIKHIGDYAMSGCISLAKINIPSSVIDIGNSVFSGCYCLKSITVAEENTRYHSDGNCIIETESKTFVAGCANSIIPKDGSVTSIGNYAFDDCSISSIDIPKCVTSIGDYAFYDCKNLFHIDMSENVTSIGNHAFWGCRSLESIDIPNSTTSIGDYAFSHCDSLKSIIWPSGVANIGKNMFAACQSLSDITIPNGVEYIGDRAFAECRNLRSIVIPKSVAKVGLYIFKNCNNLTVYCEAESEPTDWGFLWSFNAKSVIWGCNEPPTMEKDVSIIKKRQSPRSRIDLLDVLLDEDNKDPIVLMDDRGKQIAFAQVAIIPFGEGDEKKLYVILKPIDKIDGMEDDEVLVFIVLSDDYGNTIVKVEENVEIAQAVMERYKELLKQARNKNS